MQVDFYQLSRDPLDKVVPLLAGKVVAAGAKLSIAVADDDRRQKLADALWAQPAPAFLANGMVGDGNAARQPILLGPDCSTANGATMTLLADGVWRETAEQFERAILLFDDTAIADARALWKQFSGRDDRQNRFFKQDDTGRWSIAG